MGNQSTPITPVLGGFEVEVITPPGYTVHKKDFPPGLPKIPRGHWIVNFGFQDQQGKPVPDKFSAPYQIRVHHPAKDPAEFNLFFWNGEFIIPLTEEFHGVNEVRNVPKPYKEANLVHTDPPCGWR